MKRRWLCLLIVLAMVISMMPAAVMADEGDGNSAAPSSIEISYESSMVDLGSNKLLGAKGDTFQFSALNQDGEETPVTWSTTSSYVGTITEDGLFTVTADLSSGGSSSMYVKATSTLDTNVSKQISLSVTGYMMSAYSKTQSVTLSTDGQTVKTVSLSGGYAGHNSWSYDIKDGIAEVSADPGNGSSIKFNALRPGTFTATVNVDYKDSMTDTATITVNGVSVETADEIRSKAYLSISSQNPNPTMQLNAFSSTAGSITWDSADDTIASVSEDGLVTAKGLGSVIISATDADGNKGGIKMAVTDAETPYFESLEFSTTAFVSGTWVTGKTFSPKTMEYELPIKTYSTSTLSLMGTTLYDTEKYSAVANYKDVNGIEQNITVKSGAMTSLTNVPFGATTLTVTLSDKNDSSNKTCYVFSVTRPRDTTKAIKSTTGIVLVPDGRPLLTTFYNGAVEGTMFKADETGELSSGKGVSGTQYFYRTYAQDGLDSFALTVNGNTAYTHIRYSTDGGVSWNELAQSGGRTKTISFPAAQGDGKQVAEIQIQVLDDSAYSENVKAGNDGFNNTEPSTYKVWVERIAAVGDVAVINTAKADSGDWYPAFSSHLYSYYILVPNGGTAPTLNYTVPSGASVKIGTALQTPNEKGEYTLELSTSQKSLVVTSADGQYSNTYKFGYQKKSKYAVPDKVVDYLCINSQYTNGGYGIQPELTLAGTMKSLGNFGGFITYFYEDAIKNNHNNPFGVDFLVYGNANVDTSTNTGCSFFEPGQVWVSEDGDKWYALAGSEHYEDSTKWDYTVTYTEASNGKTAWTDNYGNSNDGTAQTGTWAVAANYPYTNLIKNNSIRISGILLPSYDGTVTGDGTTAAYANPVKWGYSDCGANGTLAEAINPYLDNSDHKLKTSGFDLAWAVDEKGNPVEFENGVHYIKVVTASNIWGGAFGEKSTEITNIMRATEEESAVGKTAAPAGVTISDGIEKKVIYFTSDKHTYTANLDSMKYVSISVDGTAVDDNIYVNNQRIASGEGARGIKVTKESGEKLVRIIVQNGEKEPDIYLLKLTSSATESNDVIEGVKINAGGTARVATTTDGEKYNITVGHKIAEASLLPISEEGTTYTVNGEAAEDCYNLEYGKNTFTIAATGSNGVIQTVTLTITREDAPVLSGAEVSVYFTLLGDDEHGDDGTIHTYKNTKNKLKTWIAKKSYTVPKEATVLDVFEKALKEAGIPWKNAGGNYISEINGLAEFDNGELSGWMYLVNGKHPDMGLAEQTISAGDNIIWHYTDDYTAEEGSEKWGGSAYGGTTATTTLPTGTVEKPAITAKVEAVATVGNDGKATVKPAAADITKAIETVAEAAKKDTTATKEVVLTVSGDSKATSLEMTIPKASVTEINKGADKLTISSSVGEVSFDADALKTIAGAATADLKITIAKEESRAVIAKISGLTDEAKASLETKLNDRPVYDFSAMSGNKEISQFGGKVQMNLTYTPASGEDKDALVAYWIKDNGNLQTVIKSGMASDNKHFGIQGDHWSTYTIGYSPVTFDDTASHWAKSSITFLAARDVIKGKSESSFAPNAQITRAEFVQILANMSGDDLTKYTASKFTDVSESAWYANAVAWAVEKGIAGGTSDDTFSPDANITRQDMSVMISKYAANVEKESLDAVNTAVTFADAANIASYAKDAVSTMQKAGIISGVKNADKTYSFNPKANATRAEAATMIANYIK